MKEVDHLFEALKVEYIPKLANSGRDSAPWREFARKFRYVYLVSVGANPEESHTFADAAGVRKLEELFDEMIPEIRAVLMGGK